MTTLIGNLSAQQLRRAAAVKDKIGKLEQELNRILGEVQQPADGRKRKRKMSASARREISAKLKAAWARRKAGKAK